MPFDDSGLSEFARAWYKSEPQKAKIFIETLSRARLADLGRIPLLATVAAALFGHREAELQDNRASLYEEFVRLILRLKKDQRESARELLQGLEASWREALGPNGVQLVTELFPERRRLLEFLAVRQSEHPNKPVVDELLAFIRDELIYDEGRRKWLDRVSDRISEELLPDFLTRTGLLTQRAGTHMFIHDTFQEYLTAAALARDNDPDSENSQELLAQWHEVRWREVLLFMLGKWSEQGQDVSHLLRAVGTITPALSFSGTAIAEGVRVSSEFESDIKERLFRLARFTWRWDVLYSLQRLAQRPEVAEKLVTLATDPTVSTFQRIAICRILKTISKQDTAAEILRSIAVTPRAHMLERAEAMYELEKNEARALMRDLLAGATDYISKAILGAYGRELDIPEQELREMHLEILNEVQNTVHILGAFSISLIGLAGAGSPGEEFLRSLVAKPNTEPSVKLAAWNSIGSLGHAVEAAEGFASLLEDTSIDAGTRVEAARNLHQLGRTKEAAATLALMLDNESMETASRVKAATALGELGQREKAVAILRCVFESGSTDADRLEAAKALETLGLHGDSIESLKRLAADSQVDASVRLLAAQEIHEPGLLEGAAEWIRDVWKLPTMTASDRLSAAVALGEMGFFEEMAEKLRFILEDPQTESSVRMSAAEALAHNGCADEALVFLQRVVLHGESSAQLSAASKLAELGFEAEAVSVLRHLSGDLLVDYADREKAVGILADLGFHDDVKRAVENLKDDFPLLDSYDRVSAAKKFLKLGFRDHAKDALKNESFNVDTNSLDRQSAAKSLAEVGFPGDAKDALLLLISDSSFDDYGRVFAAKSLAEVGFPDDARAALRQLATAPNVALHDRVRAVEQLAKLGFRDDNVEIWRSIAVDTESDTKSRIAAADALSALGLSEESIEVLRSILTDPATDFSSRISAAGSLVKLDLRAFAMESLEKTLSDPKADKEPAWEDLDQLVEMGFKDTVKEALASKVVSIKDSYYTYSGDRALEKLSELGFIDAAVEPLLQIGKDPESKDIVWEWAVGKLIKLGFEAQAVELLRRLVVDPEAKPNRGVAAAEKLAQMGYKKISRSRYPGSHRVMISSFA